MKQEKENTLFSKSSRSNILGLPGQENTHTQK